MFQPALLQGSTAILELRLQCLCGCLCHQAIGKLTRALPLKRLDSFTSRIGGSCSLLIIRTRFISKHLQQHFGITFRCKGCIRFKLIRSCYDLRHIRMLLQVTNDRLQYFACLSRIVIRFRSLISECFFLQSGQTQVKYCGLNACCLFVQISCINTLTTAANKLGLDQLVHRCRRRRSCIACCISW
ncbi:hypothetical protein D3C76_1246330 [compost metagenome]